MKYSVRGILFDLDGTLVDSMPDIAHAVNLMLESFALPPRPMDQLLKWVGHGSPALVKRALTGQIDGEPDPALFAKALPRFLDLYANNVFEHSFLYDDVRATLKQFTKEGFKMGCVTNKPMRHTQALLRESALDTFFSVVVAGDTLPTRKPAPDQLLYAAEKLALNISDCIMVGDSPTDVRAAQAAAIPVLCLTYGYNQGQDLTALEADQLVERFAQLTNYLEKPAS